MMRATLTQAEKRITKLEDEYAGFVTKLPERYVSLQLFTYAIEKIEASHKEMTEDLREILAFVRESKP